MEEPWKIFKFFPQMWNTNLFVFWSGILSNQIYFNFNFWHFNRSPNYKAYCLIKTTKLYYFFVKIELKITRLISIIGKMLNLSSLEGWFRQLKKKYGPKYKKPQNKTLEPLRCSHHPNKPINENSHVIN